MPDCTSVQRSLAWCQGKPELPGVKRRIYYISKYDIVSWPTLSHDFNGRLQTAAYTGKFTLRSDAKWEYIDIIPDKFPILGKIDDVYMILSSVAKVLRTTDREVLMRYWQGDPELMDKVRNILIKIDEKLGSGLTGSVLRYVEKATAGAVPA
jgi:hypothetical protein